MTTYTYLSTDEDPSIPLAMLDMTGAAVDLSTATFSVKLTNSAGTVALTKTTGVTGYASLQGTSPDQYNCLITWAAGELALTAGAYTLTCSVTISGRQRTFAPGERPRVVIVAAPS